jgi:uncharacterized coiled-coil DUF342 family protein
VPGRHHLSEEDERAEADERERLFHAQSKLRELRDRRGALIDQIRQLSDEQHALHDRMNPEREGVEATHEEYRELGHRLAEVRAQRDALRPRLEAALAETRTRPPPGADRRGPGPARPPPRPEQIRQEMAKLELRQQTQALPLAEENALIDYLRELRKALVAAEKNEGARAQAEQERQAKLTNFRELRAEFERLGEELARLKAERDGRMAAMRSKLAEVGQEISQIREKARARAALFEKVDEVNRQMVALDREIRETLIASRARRQEARQTISQFTRSGRDGVGSSAVASQAADDQFQQLMKTGKVTLGG